MNFINHVKEKEKCNNCNNITFIYHNLLKINFNNKLFSRSNNSNRR